jgi:hypothetical protein
MHDIEETEGLHMGQDTTRERFDRRGMAPLEQQVKVVAAVPRVKEVASKLWKETRLLHPDRAEKMCWDGFVGVLIVYSVCLVPYRIGFSQPACEGSAAAIFEWIVDAFFFLDIFINFDTAYFDREDFLIVDRKKIAKHYIVSWFAIDFASTMPIDTIIGAMAAEVEESAADIAAAAAAAEATGGCGGGGGGAAGSVKLVKVLRLVRLMKLLRLLKLGKSFKRYMDALGISLGMSKLIKLLMAVVFLSHLLACVWFYIGYENYDPTEGGLNSWVKDFFGTEQDPLRNVNSCYICSMYWTIATMSAVGKTRARILKDTYTL